MVGLEALPDRCGPEIDRGRVRLGSVHEEFVEGRHRLDLGWRVGGEVTLV